MPANWDAPSLAAQVGERGVRDGKPVGICTACEDLSRCKETFVCRVCFLRKPVCTAQVGGFGDPRKICSVCHMRAHGFSPKQVRTYMHGGHSRYTEETAERSL